MQQAAVYVSRYSLDVLPFTQALANRLTILAHSRGRRESYFATSRSRWGSLVGLQRRVRRPTLLHAPTFGHKVDNSCDQIQTDLYPM